MLVRSIKEEGIQHLTLGSLIQLVAALLLAGVEQDGLKVLPTLTFCVSVMLLVSLQCC